MQADRKKIGIFIIVLGLVIIFLIIYFVFIKKNVPASTVVNQPTGEVTTKPSSEPSFGTSTPGDGFSNHQNYDISKEPVHKTTADDLGKISMSMAERFGSFSNQSNYGNFTDLKILMTDNMKNWSDTYIDTLKKQNPNNTLYYGITTTAMTYSVKSFDDAKGQAEIFVTTQRRESTEKINGGTPYTQILDLNLVKVNGEWLFDKAYWGTK